MAATDNDVLTCLMYGSNVISVLLPL